jgi:ornithine cyclodeaminase
VPPSATAPAATGAKVVSVFGGNRDLGLPTINAVVLMVDPATGQPLGLLEGATVTALRTGAVSGAATDLMARADSRILAVIGAGAQGLTQTAAACAVRPIEEIRVSDLSQDARESFAERLKAWAPDLADRVRPVASTREAVEGADVICTATTSTRPVFEDGWLKEGTHINGIGAYTPEMQEVPDETVGRARIVVDAVEAVLHEAGDLVQPISRGVITEADIQVELGHVVDGIAPGRQDERQITFFKSVGNAIQDMIVGAAALKTANERGIGTRISLD